MTPGCASQLLLDAWRLIRELREALRDSAVALSERHGGYHTTPVVRRAIEGLCARAGHLVGAHWGWIERAARLLSVWRRLSGDEIRALKK